MYPDTLFDEEESVVKTYELWIHGKQGHEFASCLENNETAAEALELWSERLLGLSKKAAELAAVLKDQELLVNADNNYISFEAIEAAGQAALDLAVEMDLLDLSEWEV